MDPRTPEVWGLQLGLAEDWVCGEAPTCTIKHHKYVHGGQWDEKDTKYCWGDGLEGAVYVPCPFLGEVNFKGSIALSLEGAACGLPKSWGAHPLGRRLSFLHLLPDAARRYCSTTWASLLSGPNSVLPALCKRL